MQFLAPRFTSIRHSSLPELKHRLFRTLKMMNKLIIRILKNEIIMNECLPINNAEQMNQSFGIGADEAAESFTAVGVYIKQSKVDVRVRVNRVKKAAKCNGVGSIPELENAVNVGEVG